MKFMARLRLLVESQRYSKLFWRPAKQLLAALPYNPTPTGGAAAIEASVLLVQGSKVPGSNTLNTTDWYEQVFLIVPLPLMATDTPASWPVLVTHVPWRMNRFSILVPKPHLREAESSVM